VRPERYDVALELDPQRTKSYRGRVRIELQVDKAASVIELHAADLKVSRAKVLVGERRLRARAALVPEHEVVRIAVGEKLKGRVTIELTFRGKLRSDLRGLYFAQSGARKYAFTQLEAADARRFFPCFDEPSFKARFAIEVTTAAKLSVISNNPVESRRVKAGKQTVRFSETTQISTYLVALGVGELVASETAHVKSGKKKVPIRVLHAPMKGGKKLTRFALDAAVQTLARLEKYFGVPYPYEKLDLVAAPDFEMGAMENVGAVFFRETLLLIDEERATLPEKKRAVEVICHELAHMWYGNLVTMAWWDDLWLNEAFATWMAFEIVHQWQPKLRMWNDFGHSRASAFDLDALTSTHAIYTDVKNAAEATESFDLITYEKGASVIRMLERYLGPEKFRAGVRDYIRAHAHGNAVADDLWRALERHAGDDVARVVRPWIERPGFPVVAVKREKNALVLEQERFSAAGPHKDKTEPWPVPMVFRELAGKAGKARTERFLLKTRTASIALKAERSRGAAPTERSSAAPVIYANADEGGFYHPLYDAPTFAALLDNLERLDAAERLGLIGHTFALTSAGYMPLGCMIDLALALADERDPDVLSALSAPLMLLVDRLARAAGPVVEAALKQRITKAFAPELKRLGLPLTKQKSEPLERALRRTELLEIVGGIAEDEATLAQAAELGARYLQRPASLEPNLGGLALALAARSADLALHAKYLKSSETAETPQERRRFRMALAEARDPRCVERTLNLCLTPKIPTQDVAIVLSRLCENPAARALTFARVKRDWSKFSERLTPALSSRFVEATRSLQTDVDPKQLLSFLDKAKLAGSKRALAQLKERLALDTALRARASTELRSYFKV
jgi:puromycin-sensitive aminopeptidase